MSPGKNGAYYYTNFFHYYNMEASYHPLQANNLHELQRVISKNEWAGLNVSMPFKGGIVQLLDISSPNVDLYKSCNTVKIANGKLHGYNTDINGVTKIASQIFGGEKVIVLGNGAMGKTFEKVFKQHNIDFQIISRSLGNWERRHQQCDVLVNCTPFGTSIDLSPLDSIFVSRTVFDLAINGNKLQDMCKSIIYVSGLLFYKEVFLEQFFLHTGVLPDSDYFDYLTAENTR